MTWRTGASSFEFVFKLLGWYSSGETSQGEGGDDASHKHVGCGCQSCCCQRCSELIDEKKIKGTFDI